MINYDANVIKSYAEKLYNRAFGAMFFGTLFGAVLGGIPGISVFQQTKSLFVFWTGAIVVGFLGLILGSIIAASLKLKAQLALCQVQIEENTRAVAQTVYQNKASETKDSHAL